MNYYNEFDPHAAAWLRGLISEGLIPAGDVDERSISEVNPIELVGYRQCHFFAGIGGWSLALQLAGWPEDEPVWTGSCPCQPWSVAAVAHGGGKGYADDRHLWPAWHRLIRECGPPTVFGEQVANAVGKGWLDTVAMDLEADDYAFAAAILPAHPFGAPHQRKRLWFVAHAGGERRKGHQPIERVPIPTSPPLPIDGNPLAGAWRALGGDFRGLLPCDGLPLQVARDAVKGYGNAIVPQVAAEFIQAVREVIS